MSIQKYLTIIESADIAAQFDLFNLICYTFNTKNRGFRYCEFPENLKLFIDNDILYQTEATELSSFRKMDKGRKSKYFLKFAKDIEPFLRKLHDSLQHKFPKVKEYLDTEHELYVEKRIIDPKYL